MFGHRMPLVLIDLRPDAGPNAGKQSWIFRGSVPVDLARVCDAPDPAVVAEYDRTAKICGPGFATKAAARAGHKYGDRIFYSKDEALAAAADIGAAVAGEG